jgi:hypothetical protein
MKTNSFKFFLVLSIVFGMIAGLLASSSFASLPVRIVAGGLGGVGFLLMFWPRVPLELRTLRAVALFASFGLAGVLIRAVGPVTSIGQFGEPILVAGLLALCIWWMHR